MNLVYIGTQTPANFEEGLSVVDFWADWCRPCKAFKPAFSKLAFDYLSRGINFYTADIENNRLWVKDDLKITSIPCVIVFYNGKEINRFAGNMLDSEILRKSLDTYIAEGVYTN